MNSRDEAKICAGIAASGLFDGGWYLRQYPDVAASGLDPVLHYVRHGEREGRKPSAQFAFLKPAFRTPAYNALYEYIANRNYKDKEARAIPVAFACHENSAPALSVALASLAANANCGRDYAVYIIYDRLADENLHKLRSQAMPFLHIIPVCVQEYLNEFISKKYIDQNSHIDSYLKVMTPHILSRYNKIVYLVPDIIINTDIAQLYSCDIDGCMLGAVEYEMINDDYIRRIIKKIGKKLKFYFNGGVMLIDTAKFINYRIFELYAKQMPNCKNYVGGQQDIMNMICEGHVKKLELTWNYEWTSYLMQYYKDAHRNQLINYACCFKRPNIVNFISGKKPLNSNDGHFAPMFWRYARFSPFFDELRKACAYPLDDILGNLD